MPKRVIMTALTLALWACGAASHTNPATGQNSSTGPDTASGASASNPGAGQSDNAANAVATSGPNPSFIGRYAASSNNEEMDSFGWPAFTIALRYQGSSIGIRINAPTATNYAIKFNVYVDGFLQPNPIILSQGLNTYTTSLDKAAEHTIAWVKASEASYGGQVTFAGFVPSMDGVIAAHGPATTNRSIEFIGDSITTAYGSLSQSLNLTYKSACPANGAAEDTTLGYAFLTAQKLKANYSIIAFAGRGLYRNYPSVSDPHGTSNPNMVALWPLAVPSIASSITSEPVYDMAAAQQPSVVVINLGTNDYAAAYNDPNINSAITNPNAVTAAQAWPDPTVWTQAYASFIVKINRAYPKAIIVPMVGPLLADGTSSTPNNLLSTVLGNVNDAIAQARTSIGNANLVANVVNTGSQVVNGPFDAACEYHPSLATHQSMAQTLAAAIAAATGWQ